MKIIISILIILFFGSVGYYQKYKIINQVNFLNFVKKYVEYLDQNMNLFQNNILDITNNFIILEKIKNAKYIKIFENNTQKLKINKEIIKDNIKDQQITEIIYTYFLNFGTNDLNFEDKRNCKFLNYLNDQICLFESKIKSKGDLSYKILLAIGAIIAIIIW